MTSNMTVAWTWMLWLSWTTTSDKTHIKTNWQRVSCNKPRRTRTATWNTASQLTLTADKLPHHTPVNYPQTNINPMLFISLRKSRKGSNRRHTYHYWGTPTFSNHTVTIISLLRMFLDQTLNSQTLVFSVMLHTTPIWIMVVFKLLYLHNKRLKNLNIS